MGYEMRSWYDICPWPKCAKLTAAIAGSPCDQFEQLIENEIERGIPSERIVIAGFFRGAVALTAIPLLRKTSGWDYGAFYLFAAEADYVAKHRTRIPKFLLGGAWRQDPWSLIPWNFARPAKGQNYEVQWHGYAMPHAVCLEEIAWIF